MIEYLKAVRNGVSNTVKGMEAKYRQRKFLLACFFAWVITIALFTDKINGGEFNMALLAILGMYGVQSYFGSKEDAIEVNDADS